MADDAHKIITINRDQYLLTPTKVSLKSRSLQSRLEISREDLICGTGIVWDRSTFNKDDLENVCLNYSANDDVWCRDFLSYILLLHPGEMKCGTNRRRIISIDNEQACLPSGPLVIDRKSGDVFLVAKLHPDPQCAFVSSVLPSSVPKAPFLEYIRSEEVLVPVPSRLYFPPNVRKPLNGVRVAVKDAIALKGLPTSFGNKAWLQTHTSELHTAPCIQALIEAGVVVLGKVKTTEFAEGIDACDWVDTKCPFNPRGDGQQQASSSSSGSAVAIAAYEWLDVAIGTDTGGSIRHPAGVNGCFGQRPTHGRVDLTGVLGATDLFNTVGIFARDIATFCRVGKFMVDNAVPKKNPLNNRKVNLLYPTRSVRASNPDEHHHGQHRWFPHPEVDPATWTEAEKRMEEFVAMTEKLLNCRRIPFNINELWHATPVIGQPKSLDDAVGRVYSTITTSGALRNGISNFLSEYRLLHDGEDPQMSEVVRARLEHGRKMTPDDIAKALDATAAFREWTETTLFGSYDRDATTVLIFPQSYGRPVYRKDVPNRTELFNDTFSIYAFGYLVGCPDYTLPVAEVPYMSEVSGKIEYLPASVSLIGRPGTDLELFDIMEHLHEHGALPDVKSGPRMYSQSP